MKKILAIVTFILAFAFCGISAFSAPELIITRLNYDGAMHDYKAQAINVEINGKRLESYNMIPIVVNNRTLVCARDVFGELNCEISWDDAGRATTVTRGDTVISIPIDSKTIYKNGTAISLDTPSKIVNGFTMIPVRAVAESLGCSVSFNDSERIVYITETAQAAVTTTETTTAPVTETTTEATTEAVTESVVEKPVSTPGKNITVLWDTISSVEANDTESKKAPIEGLDVICPTWYTIKDGSGSIESFAKATYTEWAHSQGYVVWPVITNSFSSSVSAGIFSSEATMDKIIDALVKDCIAKGVDGINIDFEGIGENDGDNYVKFVRKLTEKFHAQGLAVSVDTFVPAPYNGKYHLKEMADICDYVIMMAYDEHNLSSAEAGSVSSLPWVETYLQTASDMIDMDKLILGCVFYTRVWEVKADGTIVGRAAVGMEDAAELISQHNGTISFDEETGQNVAAYTSDAGNSVTIWLEDETSVRARMELGRQYGCGGAAFWRRGFETSDIWGIINEYY